MGRARLPGVDYEGCFLFQSSNLTYKNLCGGQSIVYTHICALSVVLISDASFRSIL